MQAIMVNSAAPRVHVLFARRHGRDYMMRSEKRNGYNYGGSPSNGRKPKRRRKRAGFFYILFTLLLSVILWPAGMIMLWRRKLRWKSATKLLTSLTTLILCVTLFGFALTVQTDNPDVTRTQDAVNDFLDNAAVEIGNTYGLICRKAADLGAQTADLGDALSRFGMRKLADGLDAGTELSGRVHDGIASLQPSKVPDATDAPDESASPEPAGAVTATPKATSAPTPAMTLAPTGHPVEGTLTIGVPQTTPDADTALPIGEGMLTRDRELSTLSPTQTPTEVPAAADTPNPPAETPTVQPQDTDAPTTAEPTVTPSTTPKPTAEPTPSATEAPTLTGDLIPKPAGEAVVYYNNGGVNYHMRSTCKNMSTAKAGTLADAVEKGLRRCRRCGTPDADILEVENVVWTDENGRFHLSDECTAFAGDWALMSLEDAIENDFLPCASCNANLYMTAMGAAIPTATPGPTPTPSPTPEPTPTPEPETVSPSVTLKPAADAQLYHSSNSRWYHTIHNCSGMGGAKLFSFESCVEDGLKYCKKCHAPKPELLEEHCLWMDGQELCHTSDECSAFDGKWTLISRDDALAEGHSGCAVCGADEYLVSNTVINYPEN